jgi:serine/threonine protein kinase
MEFVDGQTLSTVMKRGERKSLDQACEICQKIAEALGYAHRHGVVHRDIKPANILMTSAAVYGEQRPKVADFGVAKLTADHLTLTGSFLGTPAFMPPEQFTGEPIDGRTDLFSLGVILYWLATGEQPFPGETMTTVSYRIVHTEPIPPARLNPAISSALDAVILKSLAKSPSDRFQSGEEFAETLARLRATPGEAHVTLAPRAVIPAGDSQETVDFLQIDPSQLDGLSISKPAVQPREPAPQARSARKQPAWVLGMVGLLALIVLGGGGYLAVHNKAGGSLAPTNALSAQPGKDAPRTAGSQPTARNGGDDAQPGADPSSTSTTAANSIASKPAASQPISTSAVPADPTTSARSNTPVPFDPQALDPKRNTRLKIDFSHFPADTMVLVEMDGKVFFNCTAADKPDNLYAPPGVHEFRVTVGELHTKKTSNTVSAEFIPKKRMTLKVELRPQPKEGTNARALDPATQVIANLKTDHFPF